MYTKLQNINNNDFWDIINPDGTHLVTVTTEVTANILLIKLNKDINNV